MRGVDGLAVDDELGQAVPVRRDGEHG
jgi:hypothetical protein